MIFVKRIYSDEELYRKYKRLFGDPEITTWGEAVWSQVAEKFVRDAKTGKIIIRTREVKYVGKSAEGHNFFLGAKSKLRDTDKAIPSFLCV